MIATALIFLLGALTATLILLLLIPLVWRRAQRLARREFNATIPTSVNEIRAEMDLVRATSAFDIRREERRAQELMEQAVRERGEAGRVIVENGHLVTRGRELEGHLAERDKTIAKLEERLHTVIAERDELVQHRHDLRAKLQARAEEMEALALRHQALKERSDEQRRHIAAADARVVDLSEALRAARERAPARASQPEGAVPPVPAPIAAVEPDAALAAMATSNARPSGSARLRAVLQSNQATTDIKPGPERGDGSENAEIRERISDIAARVIQKEIEAEGPNSRLREMIERPEPPREGGVPSLAARVRSLLSDTPAVSPTPVANAPAMAATSPAEPDPAPAVSSARTAGKRNGGGRSRPKSRR